MVAVDPIASLRIQDIEIHLGEQTFTVVGHSAADWIEVILCGALHEVLPGWFEDAKAAEQFNVMYMDGDFDIDEVTFEVVTSAAGRPYWYAFNLLGQSKGAWQQLHGRLVLAGVHAELVSLSAWLDAFYAACVDGMTDQQQRIQFDAAMEAAPPSAPINEEDEGEAFLAMMSSM